MRLLLLLVVIAIASAVEKHHHQQKPHRRGDALLELTHKNKHHVFKIEPCYPPPCPGYEYDLTSPEASATGTGKTVTPPSGGQTTPVGTDTASNNGGGGVGTGTDANGNPTTVPSDTGGAAAPTDPNNPPNVPDTPATPTTSSGGAGVSGAMIASSSTSIPYWIQIVYPPPDPKQDPTDNQKAGCCNPTLVADRAKLASLQKQIDAQTEIRSGHIKWMQDAQDAILKVQRQISATNETVFELTQDIQLLDEQMEQIRRKIRADILTDQLQTQQQELDDIKTKQTQIASQKASIQGKQQALLEEANNFQQQINSIKPQVVPEVIGAKYDPNGGYGNPSTN